MQKSTRVLVLSIIIIPVVFTTSGIDPAFASRTTLLSIVTALLLWLNRSEQITITPIFIAWCAYALLTLISIVWAQNSGEAVYATASVLLYFAFFIAVRSSITRETIPRIAKTCMVLALVLSCISLAQFYDLGFSWVPGGAPPTGTMTTKNLLSSFLFLQLPFVVYCSLTEEGKWRITSLLSWLLVSLTLLITETRAVWLATIVLFVLVAVGSWFFVVRKYVDRAFLVRAAQLGGIAALCIGYVSIFHVSSRPTGDVPLPGQQTRPFMSYTPSDTSATMRLTSWRRSAAMFKGHPFGVGAANWKISLPAYGLASFPKYVQDGTYQWTHAHNDFIEQLCDIGILGMLSYIAIFVFGFVAAMRAVRLAESVGAKVLFVLLGASTVGFAVISFFDFPKARVEHMMIFAVVLAIIDKFGSTEIASEGRLKAAYLVLALPSLCLGMLHFLSETHERNIVEQRQEQDWPAVVEECNKAYDPRLLSLDELATPILYYRAEAEFMQNDLNSALRDNLAALEAHPNHIYTLNNTASCYVRLSNFEEATVFYLRALAISPNFEESLLNLTAVYYNLHEYAKAMECVSRCDTAVPGSRAQTIARTVRSKLN